MGTIVKRDRQVGGTAYLARIRLKHKGKLVHQETRTFETNKRASQWLKERETELAKPGEIARASQIGVTLAKAIDRYLEESRKRIGKTKAQVLDTIRTLPIAGMQCGRITSEEIVTLARNLSKGRQPQTVGNYLSHLGSIFTVARPAWGYPLDKRQFDDAMIVVRRMGLASKSKERDRRPTLDELDRLMEYFAERAVRTPDAAPMQHIIAFALFSTRRQEEIVTIGWSNLDEEHSRILVRNMKHPGQKEGNDVWCDLPSPAMAIIQAMPDKDDRIFPYGTDAISAAFTRACAFLGIEDLHFHDLRHEGVSRLFETGMNIPQASAVSGHRSWSSLKRYAHIRQAGDKYADWEWLPIVTTPPPVRKRQRGPYAVASAPRKRRLRPVSPRPARRSATS